LPGILKQTSLQVDGATTMLTKDVLKLFQEAAGRKATVAEVNAVQTYVLLMNLISTWLHANPMNQVVQQMMMNFNCAGIQYVARELGTYRPTLKLRIMQQSCVCTPMFYILTCLAHRCVTLCCCAARIELHNLLKISLCNCRYFDTETSATISLATFSKSLADLKAVSTAPQSSASCISYSKYNDDKTRHHRVEYDPQSSFNSPVTTQQVYS
jgi:hypothetical protein